MHSMLRYHILQRRRAGVTVRSCLTFPSLFFRAQFPPCALSERAWFKGAVQGRILRWILQIYSLMRLDNGRPLVILAPISAGSARSERIARPLEKSLNTLLFSFESACFSAPYPPYTATGPTPRDRRCSAIPHHPLNASLYWRCMKATQTAAP